MVHLIHVLDFCCLLEALYDVSIIFTPAHSLTSSLRFHNLQLAPFILISGNIMFSRIRIAGHVHFVLSLQVLEEIREVLVS